MYMGKLSQFCGKRKNNDDTSENKRKKPMEAEGGDETAEKRQLPLSEVVSDCNKRWFQDTLKEAKTGDVNMQVLIGQMYYSGYGVSKDVNKGKFWIAKASRIRSSVWKASNKRPGYNVSDSDSDSDESTGAL